MKPSTLALIQIDNSEEVLMALGQASLEIFLGEFEDRVQQLSRGKDEVLQVQPNKICVMLNGVSEPLQIELAGAKLTRLFEAPIRILDQEIRACVHAAFVPPGAGQLDTISRLRAAESGLGDARKKNHPYVVCDTTIKSTTIGVKRTREIELAYERGEFVMYFQPQVHANYRTITGAEALMRWHHPQKGVRPPADFIPYVEQSAIMSALTWFAIKASISKAAEWRPALGIAVNISPILLHDDELVPNVQDALSIFDFPAELLTLEITEDAVIQDVGKSLGVLAQLREMGVKIAIDDFGTGYSSLANFRDLPVDELKIDQSFVKDMLERPRDYNIVKSIIFLAHSLEMKVVAEGVEDGETADALRDLGADLLQGYWFSKPVPSGDFDKLIN